MELLDLVALFIALAALLSYLNHLYLRLPTTIGIMLIALGLSLVLIGVGQFAPAIEGRAETMLASFDFSKALMLGMLSFLLFAGALHVNVNDLARYRWLIGLLASAGVIASTFIVGALSWWLLGAFGFELPFVYCLLFGALISPTDPVAVLGILRSARVPKRVETVIAGESLFNDGVAVVLFIILYRLTAGGAEITALEVGALFLIEAVGGVALGLALGYGAYRMLRTLDNYQVEVLITLALVMGGYALAQAIHVSGPIAIVVGGLLIGNHGRLLAMSTRTRRHLDAFWELIDEVLNAVLFLLIGLEVLVLQFTQAYLFAGVLAIPIVLLARLISVSVPLALLPQDFGLRLLQILTWAGLRGGISVALALSLPRSPERELIVAMTYVVVVFSIAVQGLSVGRLVRRVGRRR